MFKFFLLTLMGKRIVKEFILLLKNKEAENKEKYQAKNKKKEAAFSSFFTQLSCNM